MKSIGFNMLKTVLVCGHLLYFQEEFELIYFQAFVLMILASLLSLPGVSSLQ